MLEYNADTPTSLLEAAVIQWYWLQSERPDADQFNSLWEAVVARWTTLKAARFLGDGPLCMAYSGGEFDEDHMTVTCMMQETAKEAGIPSQALPIKDIGWNTVRGFVGADDRPLRTVFKLFPWEWMWSDPFGVHLTEAYDATRWIEPPWKLVLSSKGILALLWELFPGPPQPAAEPTCIGLIRCATTSASRSSPARAPTSPSSRAANPPRVARHLRQRPVRLPGVLSLPDFDGRHPVLGSWIIGNEAHGLGIRESSGLITDNLSQFVPHYFE